MAYHRQYRANQQELRARAEEFDDDEDNVPRHRARELPDSYEDDNRASNFDRSWKRFRRERRNKKRTGDEN